MIAAVPAAPSRVRLRFGSRIPQQRDMLQSKAPYILYRGGRGAGKTKAASVWVATRRRGTRGLIVAPTHKNMQAGALAALLPLLYSAKLVANYNKQAGELQLVDGKHIFLRSLDRPELIRGASVHWLWGDELGMVPHIETWHVLNACVREAGMLQRLVTTTPPPTGKRHWLYEIFVTNAIEGVHENYQVKTSENPYLPSSYEPGLRREFAEPYALRELDAEWVDVGAIEVYDVSRIMTRPLPPPDLAQSVRGYDTAASGGSGDYTAGVLMSRGTDGHFYIRDVVRGQWAPPERDAVMRRTAEADGRDVRIRFPQERGGAGLSQADYWTRLLAGYHTHAELENGDKIVRAGLLAAQIGVGNVTLTAEPGRWENYYHEGKHLTPAEARAKFLYNLGWFPQGRTKDESDAAWQCICGLTKPLPGPAVMGTPGGGRQPTPGIYDHGQRGNLYRRR